MNRTTPTISITRHLTGRITALTLIAAVGVLGIITLAVWVLLQQVQNRMNEVYIDAAHSFALFISDAQESLLAHGNSLDVDSMTEADLLVILPYNMAVLDLYVVDLNREIFMQQSTVGRPELESFAYTEWMSLPLEFRQVVMGPVTFEDDRPVIDMGVRINDRVGRTTGMLVARFDLTDLWSKTLEINVGEMGYAYIVDDRGQLIAFRDRGLVGRQLADLIGREPEMIGQSQLDYYRNANGVWVLASARPIEGVPWFVIVEQPIREALRPIYLPVTILLFFLLVVVSLLVNTIRFTRHRILHPLEQLSGAVAALSQGRFRNDIVIQHEDELGLLGNAFNSMGAQIQELLSTLEARVMSRTRDLELSAQVARQVATELDINRLLPQLVEQARDTFDLAYVSVFLYDSASDHLQLAAGRSRTTDHGATEQIEIPLNASTNLIAKVGRDKQHIVIEDTSEWDVSSLPHRLSNTESEILLPMLVGDRLVGVLEMQSEESGRFTAEYVEVFTTLAEQIAIAVNNAQLYARQRQFADELQEADKIKNQFLANMSHELRTPLNGIMNFTEMVSSGMMGAITEQQKELLDLSLDSSKHLLSLINDILDIAKIQAGELKLFIEDVDLYTELSVALSVVKPMIQNGRVELIEEVDEGLPLIRGDRRRIRQILLNLASNAAKFTEEGSITVGAKIDQDHILFSVTDTGIGIPEEMHQIIFSPFIQTVDGVKLVNGTGLGLPITKTLVERHGGKIWVESVLGEGTTFFVMLPM